MAVLDKNGTEYLWNKAKEKFAAKDDVPKTPEGVVLYTEQSLTDSQKAQARGNIGAVGTGESTEEVYTYVFTGEEEVVVDERTGEGYIYLEEVTKDFMQNISDLHIYEYTYFVDIPSYVEFLKENGADPRTFFPPLKFDDGSVTWYQMNTLYAIYVNNVTDVFAKTGAYMMDFSPMGVGTISITSTVPYTKTTQKIDEALLPDVTWDDVKGKPFKDTTKEVYTYVFTGEEETVTDGSFPAKYLSVITAEFLRNVSGMMMLVGGEIKSATDVLGTETLVVNEVEEDGAILFSIGGMTFIVAPSANFQYGDFNFPKSGVWAIDMYEIQGMGKTVSLTSAVSYTVEDKSLKEEYLPESVTGVTIRSSTSNSTKKFKLTVDDSGTITATEVV